MTKKEFEQLNKEAFKMQCANIALLNTYAGLNRTTKPKNHKRSNLKHVKPK